MTPGSSFPRPSFESEPLSLGKGAERGSGQGRGAGLGAGGWVETAGGGGGCLSGGLSGTLLRPSQPSMREALWRAFKWNVCPKSPCRPSLQDPHRLMGNSNYVHLLKCCTLLEYFPFCATFSLHFRGKRCTSYSATII